MRTMTIWKGTHYKKESDTCCFCGCEIEEGNTKYKISETNTGEKIENNIYCPECAAQYMIETMDGKTINGMKVEYYN